MMSSGDMYSNSYGSSYYGYGNSYYGYGSSYYGYDSSNKGYSSYYYGYGSEYLSLKSNESSICFRCPPVISGASPMRRPLWSGPNGAGQACEKIVFRRRIVGPWSKGSVSKIGFREPGV